MIVKKAKGEQGNSSFIRSSKEHGTMHLGRAFVLLPLCFCLSVGWITGAEVTGVGLNYGPDEGSESISPAVDDVQLLRGRGIRKIRLHDANSDLLRALGVGEEEEELSMPAIEVIVGLRDDELTDVGAFSPASAHRWVAKNVVPYIPRTKIIGIAVGSDVLTNKTSEESESLIPFLVPAMKNIHLALAAVGLERQIKVTAPQSLMVLSSHFPPSSGAFDDTLASKVMVPLMEFLSSSGSFFTLHLHAEDLHRYCNGLKSDDPLDFSVSSPTAVDVYDGRTGLHYTNMLDVFVDAVHVAMAALNDGEVEVVVAETVRSRAAPGFDVDIVGHVVKPMKSVGRRIDPSRGADLESQAGGKVHVKKQTSGAFSSRRLLGGTFYTPVEHEFDRRELADKSWCVANSNADTDKLQAALNWACGQGSADCGPLQSGGSCFLPNNIVAHASYAFNSYYQKQSWATGSCDFNGVAHTTTADPSTASCLYSSSTTANGSPTTPTGSTVPSTSTGSSDAPSRLLWDRRVFFILSFLLTFSLTRTMWALE